MVEDQPDTGENDNFDDYDADIIHGHLLPVGNLEQQNAGRRPRPPRDKEFNRIIRAADVVIDDMLECFININRSMGKINELIAEYRWIRPATPTIGNMEELLSEYRRIKREDPPLQGVDICDKDNLNRIRLIINGMYLGVFKAYHQDIEDIELCFIEKELECYKNGFVVYGRGADYYSNELEKLNKLNAEVSRIIEIMLGFL